jgi:hypothetical protein
MRSSQTIYPAPFRYIRMKTLYLCLLLLAGTTTFAQAPHFPWIVNQIILTADSMGVARLFTREHDEVGFVQPDGTITNEIPVSGRIVGFGKWKGDIVALYMEDGQDYKVKKEIHAMLIDGRNRKSVMDKVIYTNTGGKLTMIKSINDDQDNFQYLLIRTTEQDGNSNMDAGGKEQTRTLATAALASIGLTADLKPVSVTLSSTAVGADYIAAFANHKGELSVISHANDQIVAEKFSPDGHLQLKLTAPLDFTLTRGWMEDNIRGLFDPRNNETLTFALTAKDHRDKHLVLSYFVFDFAAGKVPLQQSSVLDGDYRRQFKDNPDWKAARNCKNVEEQRPDGIIYLNDKLVIFSEIRYMEMPPRPDAAARFETEGAIASIYDRQFHLVHQLFLDKNLECFTNAGYGLSYHVRNGKIYAFGTELDGIAKYRNALFIIDPNNNAVSKITPDYGDGSRQDPINVGGMFWSGNFFAKYQPSDKKYDGSRTNSVMTKYNYQ